MKSTHKPIVDVYKRYLCTQTEIKLFTTWFKNSGKIINNKSFLLKVQKCKTDKSLKRCYDSLMTLVATNQVKVLCFNRPSLDFNHEIVACLYPWDKYSKTTNKSKAKCTGSQELSSTKWRFILDMETLHLRLFSVCLLPVPLTCSVAVLCLYPIYPRI